MPLINASALLSYDCDMEVQGGGCSGQAQAARHGIAKCMQAQDPAFRPSLKAQGLLTRDPRAVERKKPVCGDCSIFYSRALILLVVGSAKGSPRSAVGEAMRSWKMVAFVVEPLYSIYQIY